MKKAYFAPKLDVYGNVESITANVGPAPMPDQVILNGNPVNTPGSTDGSADLILNV